LICAREKPPKVYKFNNYIWLDNYHWMEGRRITYYSATPNLIIKQKTIIKID
jgi:hypothetical protein